MLRNYFRALYQRTMSEAYGLAGTEILRALSAGGECLDCGASNGYWYQRLSSELGMQQENYHGIEWNKELVAEAVASGINVQSGDLNKRLPYADNKFQCVFGLSVLEHLLNPCHYMKECYRVLHEGGELILLTPNISTYFTAALILAGKMPSSGPHPDSDALISGEELFKVRPDNMQHDTESDTPSHRHLVVFSYSVLRKYLLSVGFSQVEGRGFGLYPFPNFLQPVLERIDPYHCHQMVFIARK
jgi:SAM-dependent methyltransferase